MASSGNATRCLYYKPHGLKSEELKDLAEELNTQCEHARLPAAVALVDVDKLKERKPAWLTDVPMLGMLDGTQQQLHLYPYLDAAEWLTTALRSVSAPSSAPSAEPLKVATAAAAPHATRRAPHGKHHASPPPMANGPLAAATASRAGSTTGVSQDTLERLAQQMESHNASPRYTDTEEPLVSTRDSVPAPTSGPKRRHAKGPPLPSASETGGRLLE